MISVPLRARREAKVERNDLSVIERLSRLIGIPARLTARMNAVRSPLRKKEGFCSRGKT